MMMMMMMMMVMMTMIMMMMMMMVMMMMIMMMMIMMMMTMTNHIDVGRSYTGCLERSWIVVGAPGVDAREAVAGVKSFLDSNLEVVLTFLRNLCY